MPPKSQREEDASDAEGKIAKKLLGDPGDKWRPPQQENSGTLWAALPVRLL